MKYVRKTKDSSKLLTPEAEAFTASLAKKSKRPLPRERKKRMLERSTERSQTGLHNITKICRKYLKEHPDGVHLEDIVALFPDNKHARKRVSDVLIVLLAAKVITSKKVNIRLVSRKRKKKKLKTGSQDLIPICYPPIHLWTDEPEPLDSLFSEASMSPIKQINMKI